MGQQQAQQLYQLLANGAAIPIDQFAKAIGCSLEQTHSILKSWTGVSFDQDSNIDGFWGLSTSPTLHSFELNKKTLYTWCAWDLLFMPVLFQQTIIASTTCPVSNKKVTLTISPNGIDAVEPEHAMITFLRPSLDQLKANVTQSFCQYVFFVESEKAGKAWQKDRKDSFLLDLETGFKLGKNIINDVFNKQ